MKRRVGIVAGGLLVITLLYAGLRGGAVDVRVAVVDRDTLSVTIAAEGQTRPRDRFTVAAPVSGRLTRLDVEEGEMVEEGQVVARLYPALEDPRVIATFRAEVSAAEARFHEAESYLEEARLREAQAEREVERRRPLLEMGAITRERLEQAELAAEVAGQRRASAESALASAEAGLRGAGARLLGAESGDEDVRPIDVRAPVAGRVLDIPDPSARVVAAGTPLLILADIGGLEVVLDVLSEDAVRVTAGNEIVLSGWGGEGSLRGFVRTVTLVGHTKVSALGVEEQRVDVIGDLADPPPSLGIGYRVSGEIVVWRGQGVLSVPTSALFRMGEEWQVFVDAEGRAERRAVVLGHRNEGAAEVLEGLAEGDRVIVFPPESVDDGTPVNGALPDAD